MLPRATLLITVMLLVVVSGIGLVGAQGFPPTYQVLLPAIRTTPPPQPFSVNLPTAYVSAESVNLTRALNPRWSHGTTISWTLLEPKPGEYHWEELAAIDQALVQIRAAGIEPIVLITDSPAWARKYAGWRCSPPANQHLDAFAATLELLSARYREGPAAVRYWEVWNEPDGFRDDIPKNEGGIGCWAERDRPVESGQSYGAMLQQAAAAIKRGNPEAQVIGGALTYWTADDYTVRFVDGMIASGGVAAVDALSFHAYGEAPDDDWMVVKASRLRQQLAQAGLGGKPLIATEVGAPCPQGIYSTVCDPQTASGETFANVYQPHYAARIPAESLALGLMGSVWFPIVNEAPGFAYSHLIDRQGERLLPRPAYTALRNAIWLLEGATYVDPPLSEIPADKARSVRVLSFQRPVGQLYVLWAHQADLSAQTQISIPSGARATCWQHLGAQNPTVTDCTPADGGTVITRLVDSDPQYIEVMP